MLRQRRRVDVRKRGTVHAMGVPGSDENSRRTKHIEACDRKPFGAAEGQPVTLAIAPGVSGASIEQDADGCEVEGDARPFDGVNVELRRERAPAIDASDGKMPPAAVIGNPEIGIGLARDIGHVGGNRIEPAFIEREMRRAAVGDPAMDHAAALAHSGGTAQFRQFGYRRALGFGRWLHLHSGGDRHHSSRPRPTVPA